jgi:hypothetical protein
MTAGQGMAVLGFFQKMPSSGSWNECCVIHLVLWVRKEEKSDGYVCWGYRIYLFFIFWNCSILTVRCGAVCFCVKFCFPQKQPREAGGITPLHPLRQSPLFFQRIKLILFIFYYHIIVALGVQCDIYRSSYNIPKLNSPVHQWSISWALSMGHRSLWWPQDQPRRAEQSRDAVRTQGSLCYRSPQASAGPHFFMVDVDLKSVSDSTGEP